MQTFSDFVNFPELGPISSRAPILSQQLILVDGAVITFSTAVHSSKSDVAFEKLDSLKKVCYPIDRNYVRIRKSPWYLVALKEKSHRDLEQAGK